MAAGIHISEEFYKKFGKKYPAETFLCQEGDPGKTMYLINTGKVAILRSTVSGDKLLATLKQGDFFGEMALMGLQDRRSASAKTLVETTVLELTREAFEALIRKSPEIAIGIINTLCERLRDGNIKISAFAHTTESARISSFIANQAEEKGAPARSPTPGRLLILKPEYVSAALGVSPKKVQLYFDLAQKTRLIGRSGDWIWVPYPAYLVPFGEMITDRLTGV